MCILAKIVQKCIFLCVLYLKGHDVDSLFPDNVNFDQFVKIVSAKSLLSEVTVFSPSFGINN